MAGTRRSHAATAAALLAATLAVPTGSASASQPTAASARRLAQVEPIRAADPDGGPMWGVRTFQGSGGTCQQFGRIVGRRFGLVDDTGRLNRLPLSTMDCRPDEALPATYGFNGTQTNVAAAGCKYAPAPVQLPGAPPLPPDPRPVCTDHQTRVLVYGVFGHDLVRVTVAGPQGHHPRRLPIGPRGDFLYLMHGAGLTDDTAPTISLTFNSGCRREGRRRLGLYGTHRARRCRIVMPDMIGRLPTPPTPPSS